MDWKLSFSFEHHFNKVGKMYKNNRGMDFWHLFMRYLLIFKYSMLLFTTRTAWTFGYTMLEPRHGQSK